MVVTISTVGYGDVQAHTEAGRVLVITSIAGMLALMIPQMQELSRVLNLRSQFARISFKKKFKD